MEQNYRDPNNGYMKVEDLLAMNIEPLTPIEIGIRPNCVDDVDRGDVLETRLLFYAGVASQEKYDTLQYHERLIDGKPVDTVQGVMLPLIDFIKPLSR